MDALNDTQGIGNLKTTESALSTITKVEAEEEESTTEKPQNSALLPTLLLTERIEQVCQGAGSKHSSNVWKRCTLIAERFDSLWVDSQYLNRFRNWLCTRFATLSPNNF